MKQQMIRQTYQTGRITTKMLTAMKSRAQPRKSAKESDVRINVDDTSVLVALQYSKVCMYSAALWATKETEETEENRELRIKTTLRELLVYLVFIIILCIGKCPFLFQ